MVLFAPNIIASLILHVRVYICVKSAKDDMRYTELIASFPSLKLYRLGRRAENEPGSRGWCAWCLKLLLLIIWYPVFLVFDIPMRLLHALSGGTLFGWLKATNYFLLDSFLGMTIESTFSAAVFTCVYAKGMSYTLPVHVDTRQFLLTVVSSLVHMVIWTFKISSAMAGTRETESASSSSSRRQTGHTGTTSETCPQAGGINGLRELFCGMFCDLVIDELHISPQQRTSQLAELGMMTPSTSAKSMTPPFP